MIKIGEYNTLIAAKESTHGWYLRDEDEEVLLPHIDVSENINPGQELTVFCYLDSLERLVATTRTPYITRGGFAALKVMEVNKVGAFLDWGLEKQLLLPFKEQTQPVQAGKKYVVYCYLDNHSGRLVASTRIHRFLQHDEIDLQPLEEVELMVVRNTDLGMEVLINGKYLGLVYTNELFEEYQAGQILEGQIKLIREDKKIDVTIRKTGLSHTEKNANKIYEMLEARNGFLPFHDKSNPSEIREYFKMSKKDFKKAIGKLYREKHIILEEKGIRMV
ncbi:CvfB family protein [Ascidiimonas aurantiaca]|uniref:CvfB family protein n=1 Tax=Ascidiimonas aurantiaca TaxID=1685432 RepID=UPI0030EF54E2